MTPKTAAKIVLYLLLLTSSVMAGYFFYRDYDRMMMEPDDERQVDLTEVDLPDEAEAVELESRLGVYGFGFLASVLFLGLLIAHNISVWVAARTATLVYDMDHAPPPSVEYEEAEQEWANGQYLEAVQMFRDYLTKHRSEIHVHFRIAEIYEKDLHNALASALEYEEILKHRLPRERWAWAAIHLCNLYNRTGQNKKFLNLLHRIDDEYGDTAAAGKARKRLALIEGREYQEEDEPRGEEQE